MKQSITEITPTSLEFSFGPGTSSKSLPGIPAEADWALCNIFVTANRTDHFTMRFSRSSLGDTITWVNSSGIQPSTQFGANVVSDTDMLYLTHYGDSDNFSSNYGTWFSSQWVPTTGPAFYFNSSGMSSTTSAWNYIITLGWSSKIS